MKKLAFECAGSFEMPKLNTVGLEKEQNIVFANGVTVYNHNGDSGSFSYDAKLRMATEGESSLFSTLGSVL